MDAIREVVIVGAGFSGLGMAIRLKQQGHEDFVVLEKADRVGGTWRDNTYPGCACDVQSLLYSFSFAQNSEWSRRFPTQPEILAYLEQCVARCGIAPHLRLGTEFRAATWNEADAVWEIDTSAGPMRARALVLGLGPLHVPKLPEIPGIDAFRGAAFHSARWDHTVDLEGKRVAVVGTGASAAQIVPAIADRVAHLTLFQRTPPWVWPRNDRAVRPVEHEAFRRVPAVQHLRRAAVYWELEGRALAFTRYPRLLRLAQRRAMRHLERQVPDPELRRRLTPDYTLGCKRIVMSDDFLPALSRDDVALETGPIAAIAPEGPRTADGRVHPVDVLVFATGFHVVDALPDLPVVGRAGLRIADAWRDLPEAYLGTTVHGFPNLFLMLGPNTGLGHSSMVFMIESQVAHVLEALALLRAGARSVEVRAETQARFNAELQQRLARTVWATGCRSWYLAEDGRNPSAWPGFTFEFWRRARRLGKGAYRVGEG